MKRLLVGNGIVLKTVYDQIEKAARIDIPVLIAGETGTGKELVAKEIHRRSLRAGSPLVAVNMGTLSKDLIYSDLFGHRKGAFTDATDDRRGRFAEADGGTLFMDEITSADERVQVALLRVLEEGRFRPLGAKRDETTDARIIAATNVSLTDAVEDWGFREDLMYRLDVFRIELPPLRTRKDDIPVLVEHFLNEFGSKFDLPVDCLEPSAMEALSDCKWPGNIRELKNTIYRAAVVAEGRPINVHHLSIEATGNGHAPAPSLEAFAAPGLHMPMGLNLAEVTRRYIHQTLQECDNNKTKASNVLGISRRTLYAKLQNVS